MVVLLSRADVSLQWARVVRLAIGTPRDRQLMPREE